MHDMPQDILALFVLALVFGFKHGLDPDHLATIDGLSRFNATGNPWLAKWAGALFSIGHGLVVTAVIVVVALLPGHLSLPAWLEGFGATVSILTLLTLGVVNLYVAFSSHNTLARPLGFRSFMRVQTGHPLLVLGIGALFALSFDTMSMATFFSLAAVHVSVESYAFVLGAVFTCGMIVSDGVSGALTARFIRQSAARALIAARVMSFAIGSLSLLVALLGVSRLLSPALEEQIEYAGIWPGMLALMWVIAGFALALSAARANKVKVGS